MKVYSVFDSMLDGVVILNTEGKVVYCNETFCNILGLSSKRMIGKHVDAVFAEIPKIGELFSSVVDGQSVTPYVEIPFKKSNSQEGKFQISAQKFEDDVLIYSHDTSIEIDLYQKYRRELGQKEDLILQLNRKVFELEFLLSTAALDDEDEDGQVSKRSVLEKVHFKLKADFICTYTAVKNLDGDWNIWVKESYHGKNSTEAELLACVKRDLKKCQGADLDRVFANKLQIIEQPNHCIVYCAARDKSGDIQIYAYHYINNIALSYENSKILESVTQQTAMLLENKELFYQSITDEKTKLYNNRYFNYRFNQEVNRSRRHNHEFALFVFDIDHFKKFNDTYGHLVGDQVLVEVAKVIKASFRSTDIKARFGGEEFVVLAAETKLDFAVMVANKVREAIKNNLVKISDGRELSVTVSIGVAYFPEHGLEPKDIFEAADRALYRAKANGRNRVEVASKGE